LHLLGGLDIVNPVGIAGPPGCGKSISAWQLARELNKAGWHVLRARTPQDEDVLLNSLNTNRWKGVAVVDDGEG
jgi:KaiC/GvpD/RAD55 family RecA-like ATPase